MAKRRTRAPRISRAQREINLRTYWRYFYRRQYYAKLMGGLLMMVLMGIVSAVSRSMMPLYLTTPIVVVSLVLLTWSWCKRIGRVSQD